jgi:hypothetical protein
MNINYRYIFINVINIIVNNTIDITIITTTTIIINIIYSTFLFCYDNVYNLFLTISNDNLIITNKEVV